jgi:hypothetical protein
MLGPAMGVADSFTVHDALDDAEKYVTAPLHWDAEDWLYFGGAVVAIGAPDHRVWGCGRHRPFRAQPGRFAVTCVL